MASVNIEGLEEYRKALLSLPYELRAEAAPIVNEAAEGMAADLRDEYPNPVNAGAGSVGDLVDQLRTVLTGRKKSTPQGASLAEGVRIEKDGPLSMRVRTTAKHAHLFEFGTVTRSLKSTGANRGKMPAKPTFIPAAIRWRDWMMTRIKSDIMRRPRPKLGEGTLG